MTTQFIFNLFLFLLLLSAQPAIALAKNTRTVAASMTAILMSGKVTRAAIVVFRMDYIIPMSSNPDNGRLITVEF